MKISKGKLKKKGQHYIRVKEVAAIQALHCRTRRLLPCLKSTKSVPFPSPHGRHRRLEAVIIDGQNLGFMKPKIKTPNPIEVRHYSTQSWWVEDSPPPTEPRCAKGYRLQWPNQWKFKEATMTKGKTHNPPPVNVWPPWGTTPPRPPISSLNWLKTVVESGKSRLDRLVNTLWTFLQFFQKVQGLK